MENIFEKAGTYVNQKRSYDPDWEPIEIASTSRTSHNVFYWNSEVKLYDIPLVDKNTNDKAGYILISDSEQLPLVIEHTTEGPSLTGQMEEIIFPALESSEIDAEIVKYHFISSLEIYAEVLDKSDGSTFYLNVPDLFVISQETFEKIDRKPEQVFDQRRIQQERAADDSDIPQYILTSAKPVRYSQNCKSYSSRQVCRIDRTQTRSACSPKAISGCVPVAWAMLLSSIKKAKWKDSEKIWKDSTTWDVEWSSKKNPNPSKCSDVESTIWKLNELMGTSHEGQTKTKNVSKGAKIFSQFGVNYKYTLVQGADFSLIKKIILAEQPFLFGGIGKWSFSTTPSGDPVSEREMKHAVVAYGYNSTERKILVCLGWGKRTSNKWVDFDQFTKWIYAYRVKSDSKIYVIK